MSVHYKFKTSLEYDTLTFDGLHISVADLKAAIFQQKRIGKTSDFDLQITNAQTKEVYSDNNTLVPKNTSLLVARVPLAQKSKKTWDGAGSAPIPVANARLADGASAAKGSADLSRMEGSEEDKIMAMMSQSTLEYDPSNYQTFRRSNQQGEVPLNYRCYKCHESGHWIKDCPLGNNVESVEVKRSTGIPRSFMVPVEGPTAPGAMITPTGVYAVPAIDHEAYQASDSGVDQPSAPSEPRKDIPEDLLCSLCKDLLTDAVMIPCCGSSFCDECLRGALLESEDHECPDCRDKDISPSTLIPNRFLRNSVATFRNQTGYIPKPRPQPPPKAPSVTEEVSPEIPEEPENPPETSSTLPEDHKSASPPAHKSREDTFDDSDGSYDDNITITVPPMQPANVRQHQSQGYSNGRAVIKTLTSRAPRLDASPLSQTSDRGSSATSTVDERKIRAHTRRVPHSSGMVHQIPPSRPEYHGQQAAYPPPPRGPALQPAYNAYGHTPLAPYPGVPVATYRPPNYLPQAPGPHQGPPPTNVIEDPLEAFERMIRQKEELARLRDKRSRSRSIHSRSRSRSISRSRSRYTRSRSRSRIRSRDSFSRSRSRPTSIRSPLRKPLDKYRRSFSRSPIMRRPIRERSKSFSRSRSRSIGPVRDGPIRRRTPPPRQYRSPVNRLRSSPRPRYNNIPPHKRGPESRSLRSPPYSQGPPPLMDPHHRYGPPPVNPVVNPVQVPPALDGDKIRYDTPFEDGPPGAQPPPPGEQSPIVKKDDIEPPGINERDKDRPTSPFRDQHNFRDSRPLRENRDSFPDVRDIPTVGRDEFRDHPPINRDGPIPMSRDSGFIREGRPPMYREGPPGFRDHNHPNDFRDNHGNNFRDGPQGYRDMPFRNGPPAGYRENIPPQGAYRDRLPPVNYRDVNIHPPNYRDGGPPFRDEPERYRDGQNMYREHFRDVHKDRPDRDGAFRDNHPHNREPYIHNREGYQQNRDAPHRDQFRNRNDNTRPHHDRGGRDYPRHEFNKPERFRDRENRDFRDPDKREKDYDRGREDRSREYEIHEKDKKHGSYHSPERKRHSLSPKREPRDERTRHRRADSRTKIRKSPDSKKDTKNIEKSKVDDEKIKEKERKDKKKKKIEKKKKRDKRDKKDKTADVQKEEHSHSHSDAVKKSSTDSLDETKEEKPIQDDSVTELYNDSVGDVEIDKDVLTNYVVESVSNNDLEDEKETSFDGIELEANDLDLKSELMEAGDKNKSEVLAPMPELSKWEIDEDQTSGNERKEPGEIDSPDKTGKVTSEVLKRAENAIFAKAINAIRPIEIKRISSDRAKLYSGELEEGQIIDKDDKTVDNIQITVPTNTDLRSVEINDSKKLIEKTPPKLSVKERLGCKVEEPKRKPRELHSTVERIRSRSRTPQGRRVDRDPQRRVMIDSSRDRGRRYVTKIASVDNKGEYRISSRPERSTEEVPHHRIRDVVKSWSPPKEERTKEERKRERERNVSISCSPDRKVRKKERKVSKKEREDKPERNVNIDSIKNLKVSNVSEPKDQGKSKERERKKSTLDEANFEPDYDENIVETDNEGKEVEQRSDLVSKDPGVDQAQTIELNLTNVRMKPKSDSSSSSEDSSSSSSSSDSKKKRRKKRKAKKKKGKHYSESGSESDSSSDEPKKKKRKHKHKKKSSKKKKKPKHKSR